MRSVLIQKPAGHNAVDGFAGRPCRPRQPTQRFRSVTIAYRAIFNLRPSLSGSPSAGRTPCRASTRAGPRVAGIMDHSTPFGSHGNRIAERGILGRGLVDHGRGGTHRAAQLPTVSWP